MRGAVAGSDQVPQEPLSVTHHCTWPTGSTVERQGIRSGQAAFVLISQRRVWCPTAVQDPGGLELLAYIFGASPELWLSV